MNKTPIRLHHYIENALVGHSHNTYVKTKKRSITYLEIYELSIQFERVLSIHEIKKGDRVVIYSSKNISTIALMIACSKLDVIYIPISSINPAYRATHIIEETGAKVIFCDDECASYLKQENIQLEISSTIEELTLCKKAPILKCEVVGDEAFILFTSGSTGTPKGVVISHLAGCTFVNWGMQLLEVKSNDTLSSIAPFNFDLSVFDIYVTAAAKATLILFTESETKNALQMAADIAHENISIMYATPTFLSTLAYYGRLQKYDFNQLKQVVFAGEVFHLENFQELLKYWPDKRYLNFYGPTETNVCTYYEVNLKGNYEKSFPIGKACSYAELLVLDEKDQQIHDVGEEGELVVAGTSLFNGYWNDIQKTNSAMYQSETGKLYYRTGDIVLFNEHNELVYIARKDRMIKKNGYRIEPSEIEQVMVKHKHISNAAVVYSSGSNQLICFVESFNLLDQDLLSLKIFCQNYLPSYMIPDKFVILTSMPLTSSGKIDLQALKTNHHEL